MFNPNIGLDMYPTLKKHLSPSGRTNVCVSKTEAKRENRCYRRDDTQLDWEGGWDLGVLGRGNSINKVMKM